MLGVEPNFIAMSKLNNKPSPAEDLQGRKVVCIADDFSGAPPLYRVLFMFPKSDRLYTVREVYDSSILLEEIVNPVVTWPDQGEGEMSFNKSRFRLASDFEIEQSIEQCIALMRAKK